MGRSAASFGKLSCGGVDTGSFSGHFNGRLHLTDLQGYSHSGSLVKRNDYVSHARGLESSAISVYDVGAGKQIA